MRGSGARWGEGTAEEVARALLGQRIRSRAGGVETGGRIVETEAYLGHDDPASHAFQGRRHAGNAGIYGPPGSWYVYRSYGIHWCLNLVVRGPAAGAAVLLRGILPDVGLPHIRARHPGVPDHRLGRGPGRLSRALGVTGDLDGIPMRGSPVTLIEEPSVPAEAVTVTPRIGISRAVDWPLRFVWTP